MKRTTAAYLGAIMATLATAPVLADPQPNAPTAPSTELRAAAAAAKAAEQPGPRDIPLAGEATLHLPAGFVFIPAAQANRYMAALGNKSTDRRQGLILPTSGGSQWLADVEWVNEGHVPDGDAKEWQPDTMLDGLRQGTEEQNKDRIARGIPALDIVGWVEPPTYDATSHRLVWSLAASERGAPAGAPQNVNYNTYALGREGFITLDMITDTGSIGRDKQIARDLLANIQYAPNKRYEDYNPSTDRLAAYGLGALIGAVAIKKLGLLAIIGVFLLKAWKIAIVTALVGWSAVKRFFGRLSGRTPAHQDVEEETVSPDPSAVDTQA